MRLFIAALFSSQTRQQLTQVIDRLKTVTTGNFTRAENLHITLAFLGEQPPKSIDKIKTVMQRIEKPACTVAFQHIGHFGDLYWLGVQADEQLFTMQKELMIALRQQGFLLETRPFRPHLTLVRKAKGLSEKTFLSHPITTTINTVALMHSHYVDGKLTYTPLFLKELKK